MRRTLRWFGWIAAILVVVPLVLVAIVFAGANIEPGRRALEALTDRLTGGMVKIDGLAGRFPDALRVRRIVVADAKGPYVTLDGLTLDWSPMQLLHRDAIVDQVTVEHIALDRLPESEPSSAASSSGSGSSSLPERVWVRVLRVGRLDVGAAVAGAPEAISIEGNARLATLTDGEGHVEVRQLDGGGIYVVDGAIDATHVQATITAQEPAHGLISGLAGLPDLRSLVVVAKLNGPMDAVATNVLITAEDLRAAATGTVDVTHEAADVTVMADAPAMTPRPDVGWQSLHLDARVHGPFTRPDANGTVKIAALQAAGAKVASIDAAIAGNAGQVTLHGTLDRIQLPGAQPDLLAGDPLLIDAAVRLDQAERPVTFAIGHQLVTLRGTAKTEGDLSVHMRVGVPELQALAAAGGADVRGHTDLTIDALQHADTTTFSVTGPIGVTGGMPQVAGLVGPDAKLDLAGSVRGSELTLTRLSVDGAAIALTADGKVGSDAVDLNWTIGLSNLAAVLPAMAGRVEARGHASGSFSNLAATADFTGDFAAQGYQSGTVTAHVEASGLPNNPAASVKAQGTLLDSPLALDLTARRQADGVTVAINQAAWKSLSAGGTLSLPNGETVPIGNLHLAMERLADLSPLLGRSIAGAVDATVQADRQRATVVLDGKGLGISGTASVARVALNISVGDPLGNAVVDATLKIEGAAAAGITSSASLTARGSADAVELTLNATSPNVQGAPTKLDGKGILHANAKALSLTALRADWKTLSPTLLAPARLDFSNGLSVDRFRLGLDKAVIELAGRLSPTLDTTASIRGLPVDIAAIASPSLAVDGTINAEARLTGSSARPEGRIKVTAAGIRMRQGPGRALPATNLTAEAQLAGTSARIDARLNTGASFLAVNGSAPLAAGGALDLRTSGSVDLAMLDPILAAQGRRVRGRIGLDAAIAGTTQAPRVSGSARLAGGEVQDDSLGARVSNLTATVEGAGDTIRVTQFRGKAGEGTIGGGGSISLAGDMPVDLRITADNARLLASDLITAVSDANLTLRGALQGDLAAGGTIHVRRADIRVPEKMPMGVAILPVRQPGQHIVKAKAEAPPPADIALNLTLDAPQQVFIRGRGLDAELGGRIHVGGTAARPLPDGGLHLRRGTLSVIGQTLKFTEGTVDFTGAGLADPAVHFVATSTTPTLVATMTVSGSAKDPKITLSSVPDAPQDEILAQMLFKQTTSKLSAIQLAQIAGALASLSGATSGVGDPLDTVRNTLGLDRLSVGSSTTGSPTLEAGRYLARGVYLGAKQNATGGGSQATVQIDIAKGLKLETTAGAGSSSATGGAGRSDAASVGLTYQFEY